jgi:DNA-binding Lrp family transcriptional regulator
MATLKMNKQVVVSAKIPEETYKELSLRIPERERSDFIREAILEKLEKTPRPDKILELESHMGKVETELAEIKKYLVELEVLTFERGKVNPHQFSIDETDHKIIDYLLHYKGATTPELADYTKTNRWLVLNRLRKMQKTSKKQLGKPVVTYTAGEKQGKHKAWWLNEELIET